MPQFQYKARDGQGTLHKNTIISENETLARNQLAEKGLWVIEISNADVKTKNFLDFELDGLLAGLTGVGLKDLVVFCRQFSVLVNSGVAMMKTLTILAEQAENPKFSSILKDIKNQVERGINLSDSFAKHPKVFDNLFINMIKAGETGGVLDDVLNRLAKFLEDRAKLTNKVKSAMTYPTVVTILATIIFFVMLTVILPKFSEIFERLGSELPAYTQTLIHISNVLRSPWLLLIIFLIGCSAYGFKKMYSIEKGRYIIDKISLKLPVFGVLIQKVAVARFTRTLGTLIKSGVPILTSLEIVEEASGNAVLSRVVREVYEEVKQGGTINAPLERSKVFPPMVVSMIAVGEETGELDSMLSKIADFYDSEVEAAVEALTSLLEPIMMVFLGGMVGAVIVGMYLPMFKMFDAVK
ncbi:MAG: pilus assembly protein PilC [Candidatus Melainabacteria bacterium RIFOXYA12_FULL_32_12]|nr:MAG: pilus assembly protein PilC [Candidatus Melainabacteria bacterium RIFOXYA2_FULL_32_9]OGI24285.1 MAG: pilus assembly protein PilC [Candidatus Melainabacteria bacterium RIFOXYA12_FULL_32_12]